jgi:hypothetical protein
MDTPVEYSSAAERLAERAGLGTQHGVFNRGQGHLVQGLQRVIAARLAADDAERQVSLQAVEVLGLARVTFDEPEDRDQRDEAFFSVEELDPALCQGLREVIFAQQAGMDQKGAGMAGEEAMGSWGNVGELVTEHEGLI